MARIAKRVDDKRLLKLIRAFLNAGVMENGLISPSVEGTPHGGPLSPLLSNVVLDELDRELECRGHRHVRYADDCNIYVCSERAGHRVMKSITRFITQRLKLKVNETKSAIARPQERKFLGFSFTSGPEIRRAIAPKALTRFKDKIREITRQAKGISIETTVKRLATYMVGWRGYFGFCETPEVLIGLIRWVRLRLRCALWRQRKTPRRRRAALLELGVRPRLPPIRPVVVAALGTWPAPKLYQWELRMHTSARSAFLHSSRTTSLTPRTAVYGPVRTVVWRGSAGDCRPYADQVGLY
jgi:RNA-directed DNA polymerase